jgi:DNA-binding NarL/FixJ family response regulator
MWALSGTSDPGGMDVRCMIIDDDLAFLHAMRSMLERDGTSVVGTASRGGEAVVRALEARPDVVLIDVRLGAESGFDVANRIAGSAAMTSGWRPTIILVSTHAEDELFDRIAANPSFGFLEKTTVSVDKIKGILGARQAKPQN